MSEIIVPGASAAENEDKVLLQVSHLKKYITIRTGVIGQHTQ